MRKLGKSALALFLAGAMAFTPAADVLAVSGVGTDVTAITVSETEDTILDTDAIETESETADDETTADTTDSAELEDDANTDSDTTADSDSDSETENDGNTESEDSHNDNTDSDSASDDNADPDSENDADTDSESENDEVEETDVDSDVDSDTEADVDSEAETDEDSEPEYEFPGLTASVLSSEQLADKKELKAHLEEINKGIEGTDYVSGELIFTADTLEEAEKIAAAYGGELKKFAYGVGVLTLSEGVSVSYALTTAVNSTNVVLPPAWPNGIVRLFSEDDEITYNDAEPIETEADETYVNENAYSAAITAYNDPFLSPSNEHYQYQHAMVGSTYAWNAGYTGKGIKIAIVDSGVSPHPDLNIVDNYNATDELDATDGNGHGSNVAGLAAAKNNNGVGGSGIAPDAEIYNVKTMNAAGSGKTADIVMGINYATSQNVDIINMSLGSPLYNGVEAQAIKAAYEKGIAVIVAAGNDCSMIKEYPAAYPGVICIGAVNPDKGKTYFSNYGSWVHFSAPGADLWSTGTSASSRAVQVNGNWYVKMSGTSQATPVFSGTAAVVLSADESIKSKTGKARVDALVAKMKKGTIASSGGAAGIVSLPKLLGIPVSTAVPNAPVFENTNKTIEDNSVVVSIKAASTADVIYYSTDGKNVTYTNGALSDNAIKYTNAFTYESNAAKATIKAIAVNACGQVSKTASITYTFKPLVSKVDITGPSAVLKGKSITLKAAVEPSYAANKKVTWSSSDSAVTVKNGKVTATSSAVDGKTYTITATSADKSKTVGTFEVTVRATAKIKAVAFKDSAGKAQKKATVTKPDGTLEYDNLKDWINITNTNGTVVSGSAAIADVDFSSSNTKVAEMDDEVPGRVNIKSTGNAVITALANDGSGKKATFTLTVKQRVTSLEITGSNKLSIGKSIKLTASVNADAANKKVKWSISPAGKGVTISNGTVKAAKTATEGTYTVEATALDESEKSAAKQIIVSNNPISKITLDTKTATIFRTPGNYNANNSVTITASVTAKSASDAVEFTSSNPGIADVTWNGNVATVTATGKATGTTKITCTALDGSGKKASCTIKVVNPASHLAITPQAGYYSYVAIGKKLKLSAVIEEEFGSVSSKAITWESDHPEIATVDKNGNVKGIKKYEYDDYPYHYYAGPITITATLNDGSGITASYDIVVIDPIKSLKISGFHDGNVITLFYLDNLETYLQYPAPILYNGHYSSSDRGNDILYNTLSFEIGDSEIITIMQTTDSDGDICICPIPLKKGSTTITLKALDGSNVKKTYKVMVR